MVKEASEQCSISYSQMWLLELRGTPVLHIQYKPLDWGNLGHRLLEEEKGRGQRDDLGLLYKCGELSSDSQSPCEEPGVVACPVIPEPVRREADTGRSLEPTGHLI